MGWRRIDMACKNCGQPLEAKPIHKGSIVIAGCEPMEYRHVGGKKSCPPVITVAKPYSNWGAFEQWQSASKVKN